MHNNLTIIDHPIMKNKLAELRDEATSSHSFRNILSEMSSLMAYEVTRSLKLKKSSVKTPIDTAEVEKIDEVLTVVSILRSGLAMLDGILKTLPFAQVGHIGIYRDKFINNTVEYYFKLPQKVDSGTVILCDPLLATGDTIVAACNRLKQYKAQKIAILSLLTSNEALDKINTLHNDIQIYSIQIEKGLNKEGYLIPGIGDVGDRLYGTL